MPDPYYKDLLAACEAALDWAQSQDEEMAPEWIEQMAEAVQKTKEAG